ncbi:MAG: hypothetical protein KUF72_00400 [Candidatus Thiodiazotropha sp. (ex Ctena orbiculata)]|nr:hypothetical protein [Candidatus Thiodiazotropha taylori]
MPFNKPKKDQVYLASALSAAGVIRNHENLHGALVTLVLHAVRYDRMNLLTEYVQQRRKIDQGIETASVEKWLTEILHLHVTEYGEVSKSDNMSYGGQWAAKVRDKRNAWYMIARDMRKKKPGIDWSVPDVNFVWLAKILKQQKANNQSPCPICGVKISVNLPSEIRFTCPSCKTPLFVFDAGRGNITFSIASDIRPMRFVEFGYFRIRSGEENKSIIRDKLKEKYQICPESRHYPLQLAKLWEMAIRASMSQYTDEKKCAELVIELVDEEWLKIKRNKEIDPDFFLWPSTDIKHGDGEISGNEWKKIGVLAFIGYHAGKSQGLDNALRAVILERVFYGVLPQVFPADYLEKWGDPGTARRLKKLAYTLAAFVRNAKRKDSTSMRKAIHDWEFDLEYLKQEFYINKFHFEWPDV